MKHRENLFICVDGKLLLNIAAIQVVRVRKLYTTVIENGVKYTHEILFMGSGSTTLASKQFTSEEAAEQFLLDLNTMLNDPALIVEMQNRIYAKLSS